MELSKEDFQPLRGRGLPVEEAPPAPESYWGGVWRRFRSNRQAVLGTAVIAFMVVLSLVGPYLSGYTYYRQDLELINHPPGALYWFGSDALGRDIFTRICYGARISLGIGFLTGVLSLVIGVLYGGISGYAGGWVDEAMMRAVEVLNSIPFLLYVILLMVLLEPGITAVLTALGAVFWLNMARIVRGQVLALKEQEFILSARLLGAGTWRILFRHLMPNSMGPVIVTMTLIVPEAIFTEAWLSFLGLGVSAPMASWGVLASEGMEGLRSYPWQLFFPAFFISLTVLAFNMLGEGLRDVLDPRLRH